MLRFSGGLLVAALAAFVVSVAAATPASASCIHRPLDNGRYKDIDGIGAGGFICLNPLTPRDGLYELLLPSAHPVFITESGNELLFSGEGADPLLRGENLGQQATVLCEKVLVHGFALHGSTLAHRVLVSFHGKCVQKIGGGANEACTEPIQAKRILAELGLLTSTNHKVVLLLVPSEGKTFAEIKCGSTTTTIEGSIVGEIPATNAKGENQLNTLRSEIEVVFATLSKNNHQSITEIFLLESQMTKDELVVSGFFGGSAAEEATATLKGDGKIEINTVQE